MDGRFGRTNRGVVFCTSQVDLVVVVSSFLSCHPVGEWSVNGFGSKWFQCECVRGKGHIELSTVLCSMARQGGELIWTPERYIEDEWGWDAEITNNYNSSCLILSHWITHGTGSGWSKEEIKKGKSGYKANRITPSYPYLNSPQPIPEMVGWGKNRNSDGSCRKFYFAFFPTNPFPPASALTQHSQKKH